MSALRILGSISPLTLMVLLGLGSCRRPVDRPPDGQIVVADLQVTPSFIRGGVPVEISFLAVGGTLENVTVELAGIREACVPERGGDGRSRCVHSPLPSDTPQGSVLVSVEWTGDDGVARKESTQAVVDFECPQVLLLEMSDGVGRPGQPITLRIEASEVLGGPPVVTWNDAPFGEIVGQGAVWTASFVPERAAPLADVIVVVTDRAGNSSAECKANGRIPFGVDGQPPNIKTDLVTLYRGGPADGAVLEAEPGTFLDDVAVASISVFDQTGTVEIASYTPDMQGSLPATTLPALPMGRVLLKATDRAGRQSPLVPIEERWTVTVDAAASGAAVRTAVRYGPAPPDTRSMTERTAELAADLSRIDARHSVVRAVVGFNRVGEMPGRYQGVNLMNAGYDSAGKAIVSAGGIFGANYHYFEQISEVSIIRWDDREAEYLVEQGPNLDYTNPALPNPRYGLGLAFDDSGCGVMTGGVVLNDEGTHTTVPGDVWQICGGPGGYSWTRIDVPDEIGGRCILNYRPIIWEPDQRRYVIAGGSIASCGDTRVLFLKPGADPHSWAWQNLQPLPSAFREFSYYLYYDPRLGGFSLGFNDDETMWSYADSEWKSASAPFELRYIVEMSTAFDTARGRWVVWGGHDVFDISVLNTNVWMLTKTATHGVEAWEEVVLDNPTPRDNPAMVYDSDREVIVVFGGVRCTFREENFNTCTQLLDLDLGIHELVLEPSYPYLQAVADLGTARPVGIARLTIDVRAVALGNADGPGATVHRTGGFRILLWDSTAAIWREVYGEASSADEGLRTVEVEISDRPERYVLPDGRVPITVVPWAPATRRLDGRLEVDYVGGTIELTSRVGLP